MPSAIAAESCQDIGHDITVHVGESEGASIVQECKLLVIKSKKVQQRCMPVVHVDLVANGVVPKLIRFSM